MLRWAESGGAAALAWHSLTNCAYLLKGGGRLFLERLLRLVEVAPVATADARLALDLPLSDVEDAFQVAAALAWQADVVVTRNVSDYPSLAGANAFTRDLPQARRHLIRMDASQIGKRAWSYAGVLQDAGLSCFEYVEQLTLLLFLKTAD